MHASLAAAASVGLYLVFAGQISAHELGAAAVLFCLALLRAVVVARTTTQGFRFTREDVLAAAYSVAGVPAAVFSTSRAFTRAIVSGTSPASSGRLPFRAGAQDNPYERGRRASAFLTASLAPDIFVLRAEAGRTEVLMHGVIAIPPRDPERLS